MSSSRNDTRWALGGDEDTGFDELMSQMGVRRIGREARSSPPQPPTPPPKTPPARAKAQPPPPPAAAPARGVVRPPAPPAPAVPAPAPVVPAGPSASELMGRVEELEQQLSVARAGLATEREVRQRLQERLRELEEARDRADGRAESLQRELEDQALQLRRLQRRLVGAGEEAPSPSLAAVLERRGLKGMDEAAFLVRGLLETRQLDGLLERLQADSPELLNAWLEDRVALLCGEHAEMNPSGRACIAVPPARCEVCGGGELRRTIRHFVDTCLVNGLTRVSIVGGPARYHHMLRHLVQHRALRVQLAPGLEQRTPGQVRSDLDNSDVILLWMRGERGDLAAQYQAGGLARVLVSHQGSIARLLAEAAEHLLRG